MSDVITLANQIASEKENIRQAIENRGVNIPATTPLADYAGKIAQIEAQVSEGDFFWNDTEYDTTASSYTVPGNYDEIDEDTFSGNTNLTSLNFNNVRKVGDGACHGCANLTTVVGNNVFEYGDDVFGSCNITSFNDTSSQIIGNNLLVNNPVTTITLNAKRIGKNVNPNNSALTSVSLPNATELGSGAFHNCDHLDTISAPNLEYVGSSAFEGMNNWNYNFDASTAQLDIVLPKAKVIGTRAFYGARSLRSITAPLVERVEADAFNYTGSNAGRITDLNFPRCTYFGENTFYVTYSTGTNTNYDQQINTLTIADGCAFNGMFVSRAPYNIVGKIGSITFPTSSGGSFMSLEQNYSTPHTADFSGLTSVAKHCNIECNIFRSYSYSYNTVHFGGAVDLKNLVEVINNNSNYLYLFNLFSYSQGGISKVWISKDLRLSGNNLSQIYLFGSLDSRTHIYTDASAKDASWTSGTNNLVGGSGTWHFDCTHQDFEDGVYNT